jgi:starch phosphorylase
MFPSASATRRTGHAAALAAAGNPALARTITEAIGDGWITDLGELAKLKPLADDRASATRFARPSGRQGAFATWLRSTSGRR